MPYLRLSRSLPLPLLAALLLGACDPAVEVRPPDEAARAAVLEGPDAIPRELVAALLARLGPEIEPAPQVLVGSLPRDLPFEIELPQEARLLGSLVQRSQGTIVVAVAQPPAEAARSYEARLRQAGWTEAPGHFGGGFQSSDATRPLFLCRGSNRSLHVSAVARPEQGSYLRIGYAVHRRSSPCDRRQRPEEPFRGVPLPTLYPLRE